MDVDRALGAVRQAVQDAQHEHAKLGAACDPEAATWLASKLGFDLPAEYCLLLARHNGAVLRDPVYYSLLESVRTLLIFREEWAEPASFWPVAGDGFGNYYCLDLRPSSESHGQVVFFETMESSQQPKRRAADSFPAYVELEVARQREDERTGQ